MSDQNQRKLFDEVCVKASRLTTRAYSTSFSLGIRCLHRELRNPIYSIYGFVRFADEIVDTFHDHDRKKLLAQFTEDTWAAIQNKISLNPILQSFQITVNEFHIEREVIAQFLYSMEMDLTERKFNQEDFDHYVLGSAEVVGLMCLRVFCRNNQEQYSKLKPAAMRLGAAFQKINFLRDLRADYQGLGRMYFPGIDLERFSDKDKMKIEEEIAADFRKGYEGIRELPRGAKLGVYVAYLYYKALFKKIRSLPSSRVLSTRIRIRNRYKLAILGYSYLKHQFNLI